MICLSLCWKKLRLIVTLDGVYRNLTCELSWRFCDCELILFAYILNICCDKITRTVFDWHQATGLIDMICWHVCCVYIARIAGSNIKMSPVSHSFHPGCKITGLTLLIYDQFHEKEAINPIKGRLMFLFLIWSTCQVSKITCWDFTILINSVWHV